LLDGSSFFGQHLFPKKQNRLSKAAQGNLERFMFSALKYLIAFPAFFLVLYGTMPVVVSAMYGGNPPPHIASLLDKQMDTFSTVAKTIFGPITPSPPAAANDKVASKEPP
jgi:hypothetical protein